MASQRDVNLRLAVQQADQAVASLRAFGREGETALKQITSSSRASSEGLERVTTSAGQARAGFANFGQQLQDVAVQLQGGTNLTTVLSQQLPQMASGFGLVGVAIGTVIGVGGALFTYFSKSAEEADKLKSSLELVSAQFSQQSKELDELIPKLNAASDAQKRYAESQAQQNAGTIAESAQATTDQIARAAVDRARASTSRPPLQVTPGGGLFGGASAQIDVNALIRQEQGFKQSSEDAARLLLEAVNSGKGGSAVIDAAAKLGMDASPELDQLRDLADKQAQNKAIERAAQTLPGPINPRATADPNFRPPRGPSAAQQADAAVVAGALAAAEAQKQLAAATQESEKAYQSAQVAAAGKAAVDKLSGQASDAVKESVRKAAEEEERARQKIEEANKARTESAAAKRKEATEADNLKEKLDRENQAREDAVAKSARQADQSQQLLEALGRSRGEYDALKISIDAHNAALAVQERATGEITPEIEAQTRQLEENTRKQLENNAAIQAQIAATQEADRFRKQHQDELVRQQERDADEQAKALQRPFRRAYDAIQDMATDTFDKILKGGVTSFEDLGDTLLGIVRQLAAQMATLALFQPGTVFGGAAPGIGAAGGVGGAGGAAGLLGMGGSLFGGSTLGSAFPSLFGMGSASHTGFTPGGPLSALGGVGLGSIFGAGALGGVGGSLLAPMLGLNSVGGGIGGGVGAAAGMALTPLLGPLAPFIGGGLGTLAGGFLGNAFSKPQDNNAQFQFDLSSGAVSPVVGKNADPANVQITQQIGSASKDFVSALKDIGAKFGDVSLEIKAGLESGFAVRTIDNATGKSTKREAGSAEELNVVALRALIDASTGGISAEQRRIAGVSKATDAAGLLSDIQLPDTIKSLVDPLNAFDAQIKQIKATFSDLTDRATALGVSTDGLAEARDREIAQVKRQRALAELQEKESIRQTRASLGLDTDSPLQAALANLRAQFKAAALDATRLGTTEKELKEARKDAESALREQFLEQSRAQERGRVDSLIQLGVRELSPTQVALLQLARTFADARRNADELGVSIHTLNRAEREQRREILDQAEEQRRDQSIANSRGRSDTLISLGVTKVDDEGLALIQLARQFSDARRNADELGVSIRTLNRVERQRREEIQEQAAEQRRIATVQAARSRSDTLISLGVTPVSQLQQALIELARQFADARANAADLGVSVAELNKVEKRRREELIKAAAEARAQQIQAANDNVANAAQGVIGGFNSLINPLSGFLQDQAVNGPGTLADQVKASRSGFSSALGAAQSGDLTQDEVSNLLAAAQTRLQVSRQAYGSSAAFQADFQAVTKQIADIQARAEKEREAFINSVPVAIREGNGLIVSELQQLKKAYNESVALLRDVLRNKAA